MVGVRPVSERGVGSKEAVLGLGYGWVPPAGLKVLIPGAAHWGWGQRERGVVLFGSYVASLAMAFFAWGTATGLAMLGFAFVAHVTSTVDAVRQSAFPGPGRWASLVEVSLGLAAAVYAPLLAIASLLAWPVAPGGLWADRHVGYLVDCWAYRRAGPRRDDWVSYRLMPGCRTRVGRVVAERGQEVEATGSWLRIGGRSQPDGRRLALNGLPGELSYRVPDGHVLVKPEGETEPGRASDALVLVSRDQILGRAWARFYPVRERHLLD